MCFDMGTVDEWSFGNSANEFDDLSVFVGTQLPSRYDGRFELRIAYIVLVFAANSVRNIIPKIPPSVT